MTNTVPLLFLAVSVGKSEAESRRLLVAGMLVFQELKSKERIRELRILRYRTNAGVRLKKSERNKRYNEIHRPPNRKRRRTEPLTMDFIRAACVVDPNTNCWNWTKTKTRGYGHTSENHRNVRVTRKVWELTTGQPPGELLVCHKCDNPSCCNFDHLFLGTNEDNMADKMLKGRHRNGTTAK